MSAFLLLFASLALLGLLSLSAAASISPSFPFLIGTAYDSAHDRLFFSSSDGSISWVQTIFPDPSTPTLYAKGLQSPQFLAYDSNSTFLYVSEFNSPHLFSVSSSGLVSPYLSTPDASPIAIMQFDSKHRILYLWTPTNLFALSLSNSQFTTLSSSSSSVGFGLIGSFPSFVTPAAFDSQGNQIQNLITYTNPTAPKTQNITAVTCLSIPCQQIFGGQMFEDPDGMLYIVGFDPQTTGDQALLIAMTYPKDNPTRSEPATQVVARGSRLGFAFNPLGLMFITDGANAWWPKFAYKIINPVVLATPYNDSVAALNTYLSITLNSKETRPISLQLYSSDEENSVAAYFSTKNQYPNALNYQFKIPYTIGGQTIILQNPSSYCPPNPHFCSFYMGVFSGNMIDYSFYYDYADMKTVYNGKYIVV